MYRVADKLESLVIEYHNISIRLSNHKFATIFKQTILIKQEVKALEDRFVFLHNLITELMDEG